MNIRLTDEPMEEGSIVNGPGQRTVLWTQGCTHKCKGCQNDHTHDVLKGDLYDCDHIIQVLCQRREVTGINAITFSGGDPMRQPMAVAYLASGLKHHDFNVWVYTGYTYEQLLEADITRTALQFIDVLVDGRFEEKLKDLTLPFRGSSNQRIIYVPESLKQGRVIEIPQFKDAAALEQFYTVIPMG